MQFKTRITQKLPFFVALGLLTVLTSCGSFQYAGYDNDGIYATEEYENDAQEPVITTSTNDSNYYKNYFAENSAEVDAIQEESEVFTDIDSYEGNYTDQIVDTLEQRPAYGGWGQNSNTVTINYIDNGWYGYNSPWNWNSGFGYGHYGWERSWGWNNWGWNNHWSYGGYYGSGYGYGYGYGHYAPWRYGYNNYGWNNGYSRNNRYAYNNTRRGSLLYNNNLNRRSNSALSRSDYSSRRLSNSSSLSRNSLNSNLRSNTSSRIRTSRSATTTNSTRTIRNSSTTTGSNTNRRVTRPTAVRNTSRTTTTRSTAPTRSSRSSSTARSSSNSSSRSSGTVRSSSSSSRSSSGSSSSSSRRGGRG